MTWDRNTKFAKYYNLLTSYRDFDEEIEAVLTSLSKYETPKKILDYGCGNGNHTAKLAQRDFTVYGYDVPVMIKYAQIYNKETKVKWITKLKPISNFDSVICMDSVINYNPSLKDVFKEIKNSMKKKGIFIFNCWNGLKTFQEPPQDKLRIFKMPKGKLYRYLTVDKNEIKQTVDLKYHCLIIENKQVTDEFESMHHLKVYTHDQIKEKLNEVGFEILEKKIDWHMQYTTMLI